MITLQNVESSNLAAIGFDEARSDLYVRFKGRTLLFVYAGVPKELFESFQAAPSKGIFFAREIKPKFSHRVITVDPTPETGVEADLLEKRGDLEQ